MNFEGATTGASEYLWTLDLRNGRSVMHESTNYEAVNNIIANDGLLVAATTTTGQSMHQYDNIFIDRLY